MVHKILKNQWASEFKLIQLAKTSSAGRLRRFLRAEGIEIKERTKKEIIDGQKVHYKEWKVA